MSETVEGLTAEAQAGLKKKGVPKGLAWFQFEAMPKVRWENGDEVPHEVIKWWIAQQVAGSDPEPNPRLMDYCSMLKRDDREALAEYIVRSWIARNLEPSITMEEATKMAEEDRLGYLDHWGKSREESIRDLALFELDLHKHSSIKEKGMLAVAAACGGRGIAPMIDAFIKEWAVTRTPQCRALVHVLPWLDDKPATQLLLNLIRHRAKTLRGEAEGCVNALSERKGWSLEELADRTIPTAGFDENGEMLLDYGKRSFTARIDPGLGISLYDEDGQIIKSLPDARKDDDPEKVKESKQSLSDARKQIKEILALQKERLYEAMCKERSWNCEDWRTCLLSHPIIRYYCQGIIWKASDGDSEQLLRPLDDGSFTDYQDKEVKLSDQAAITIAHSTSTVEETRKLWLDHLKDYEIVPPFEQFDRPPYILHEELKDEKELKDFKGQKVPAGKMLGRAKSLGYSRVTAGNYPFYAFFGKKFASAGLHALIEFDESTFNDLNERIALHGLHFEYIGQRTDATAPSRDEFVSLGEIPPVILSECWNDMRMIAEQGMG